MMWVLLEDMRVFVDYYAPHGDNGWYIKYHSKSGAYREDFETEQKMNDRIKELDKKSKPI